MLIIKHLMLIIFENDFVYLVLQNFEMIVAMCGLRILVHLR